LLELDETERDFSADDYYLISGAAFFKSLKSNMSDSTKVRVTFLISFGSGNSIASILFSSVVGAFFYTA